MSHDRPTHVPSVFRAIIGVFSILSSQEKTWVAVLGLVATLYAGFEAVSLSAVFPFVALVTQGTESRYANWLALLQSMSGVKDTRVCLGFLGVILIAFYTARCCVQVAFNYAVSRFSYGRQHSIASQIFSRTMAMDYAAFCRLNTATITKQIMADSLAVSEAVHSMVMGIAEAAVFISVFGFLVYLSSTLTAAVAVFLVLLGGVAVWIAGPPLRWIAVVRDKSQRNLYATITESLANFKVLRLTCSENRAVARFSMTSGDYARARTWEFTLANSPASILETAGLLLAILLLTYVGASGASLAGVLPLFSTYGLALMRLLPSINRISSHCNTLLVRGPAVAEVVATLRAPESPHFPVVPLSFNRELRFRNVSYRHGSEETSVIRDLSLRIGKGDMFAITGRSGVGKSTLLDLLMGFVRPDSGEIEIDGRLLTADLVPAWQTKIGYVGQGFYFFDGTVGDNIAFGRAYVPEEISTLLDALGLKDRFALGIETHVGENGVHLSGGERQRIAIARALYGNPQLLVMDEPSSALDSETEQQLFSRLRKCDPSMTIVIVTHRLNTIPERAQVITLG